MAFETQATRLAKTFAQEASPSNNNVTKLDSLPDEAELQAFKPPAGAEVQLQNHVRQFNKYDIGEMVATVSDQVPFARVVQGPYIKPDGSIKDEPYYTLQDSNGIYRVSVKAMGGVPINEKPDPGSDSLLTTKAEQLKRGDNNSLAKVVLDYGGEIGIRYVPIFQAIRILAEAITDGEDRPKLVDANSAETKEVVADYLSALSKQQGSTYLYGSNRKLNEDELGRLHRAIANTAVRV